MPIYTGKLIEPRVKLSACIGGTYMKYLVTGANGFVGKALCPALQHRGYEVRAAHRSSLPEKAQAEVVVGPIDDRTDWTAALAGVEVVIHLAARVHIMHDDVADPLAAFRQVNVSGTEHLARSSAASGVKRLVYVSTIKVNGERTSCLAAPTVRPLPANSAFTETDQSNPQDPYGISKWEAEQALHRVAQDTGLEVVIVRPPLIYGPGVKGNFVQMLAVIARGIPLPLASINNLRSLLYVENLVDALINCAIHPAAAGQTYLLCDGEDISTPDLLRRLATALGMPPRLFPCPPALLKLAGKLTGKSEQVERLLGCLQVDSGKIRRDLNWQPPYTLQQGLQATADWYRNTTVANRK